LIAGEDLFGFVERAAAVEGCPVIGIDLFLEDLLCLVEALDGCVSCVFLVSYDLFGLRNVWDRAEDEKQ